MKISDLEVGEIYVINPKCKLFPYPIIGLLPEAQPSYTGLGFATKRDLPVFYTEERSNVYKKSIYIYLGFEKRRIEKRLDKQVKKTYTYKDHYLYCVSTNEKIRTRGYKIQTYFAEPKK